MFVRHDTGRHRIIRSGVIKTTDDSGKNIEASLGSADTVSTPAQIDAAVTKSHSHANKSLLDDLSVTAQNKLLVAGAPLVTHMHEESW